MFVLGQNDLIAWGLDDRRFERAGPVHRDRRSGRPVEIPDPRRSEAVRNPRRDDHVKGAADVKLAVRATRHGPVLSDISEDAASVAGPGKVVALAFTGLGDRDTTAEAFLRVNAARNWGEFLDALHLYQMPTQNLVYADGAGNIGFFEPRPVPEPELGLTDPSPSTARRARSTGPA